MTVEEKREVIRKFCNGNCVFCPLEKHTRKFTKMCYTLPNEMIHALHYKIINLNAPVNIGDDLDNPPENVEEQIERVKELFHTNDTVKKAVGTDPIKPDYYNDTRFSPFDVIDDWGLNFYLGNAVKYIKRAGKKAGNSRLQDLKKIREYIDHEIKAEEVSG